VITKQQRLARGYQYHTTHRKKVLRVVAGANAEVRLATVAKRRLATEVFMVQIFGKILRWRDSG